MSEIKRRATVLVVEDNPDLADHFQAVLAPFYRVECAHDVASALSHFARQVPDVVLVDCLVAGNGVVSVLEKAHDHGPAAVLVCRDRELQSQLTAFYECPCICQPLAAADILAAVDTAIRRKGVVPAPPNEA